MEAHGYTLTMATGSEAKQRFLARSDVPEHDFAISLRKSGPRSLLIDCELHLQPDGTMRHIVAGPRPGHYAYHLTQWPRRVSDFAYGLYFNILTIFSDPVLIFVADFSVEEVLNLLCFWMRSSRARKCFRQSRVVIITDGLDSTTPFNEFDLMIAMISELRRHEPATSHSARDVRNIIRSCFDFTVLKGGTDITQDSWQALFSSKFGFGWKKDDVPLNKRKLLRAAIDHYFRHPQIPFDIIHASWIPNPIPETFEENLAEFLEASQAADLDCACLTASALAMDAFTIGAYSTSILQKKAIN